MLLYVRFGRRILFLAYDGMAALAHTPVLPEATLVGAVSAQLRRQGRCQLRPLNVDTSCLVSANSSHPPMAPRSRFGEGPSPDRPDWLSTAGSRPGPPTAPI